MAQNVGNSNNPIEIDIDVHIMWKKEEIRREKELITRTISAISNFGKRGVIRMKNIQRYGRTTRKRRDENVTSGHLDQWKKIIDQEVMKFMNGLNIHEFSSQSHDAEYLDCHVTPAPRPITFEYNLHMPLAFGNTTRAVKDFDEALGILTRNKYPEIASPGEYPDISEAAIPISKNVHFKLPSTRNKNSPLDDENIKIFFGDVLPTLTGALANSDGGNIQVEDKDNILNIVDGDVSRNDKEVITRCLTECFNKKIWGRGIITPKRGDNWDVNFPTVGRDKIVFIVRVEAFYEGVFENEPVAYTLKSGGGAREDGCGVYEVAKMDFEDWFKAMLKQHTENKEEEDFQNARLHDIERRGSNPVCTSNEMTSYLDTQ